jgi:hypothetical protein
MFFASRFAKLYFFSNVLVLWHCALEKCKNEKYIIIQAVSNGKQRHLNCLTALYVLFDLIFINLRDPKSKCIYFLLHKIYLIIYILVLHQLLINRTTISLNAILNYKNHLAKQTWHKFPSYSYVNSLSVSKINTRWWGWEFPSEDWRLISVMLLVSR